MDAERAEPRVLLSPGGVVVAFDGSPGSVQAVEWAARVAGPLGAPLQLLTAVDVSLRGARAPQGPAAWQDSAASLLDRGEQLAVDAGAPAPERLALLRPPAEAVVAVAKRARMVVVGAQGHSRVGGLVLGSVSQRVARQAPCTVAVVRLPATRGAKDVVWGSTTTRARERPRASPSSSPPRLEVPSSRCTAGPP